MNNKQEYNNVRVPEHMKQVFVSFHWSDIIKNQQGFGNMVLAISPELYMNNIGKLIQDLTHQIKVTVDSKLDVDGNYEVLYFK